MRTVVEVGGWEHDCCGPAYERNTVTEVTCRMVSRPDGSTRWIESRHDLPDVPTIRVRGRVAHIGIEHPDGSVEQIERLPSGHALNGFDDHDDGHLEQPWTGQPVTRDSSRYLITIAS